MGYCMDLRDAAFNIKPENQPKALQAIKNMAEVVDEKGSGGSYSGGEKKEVWYAWVTTSEFLNATTLKEAMDAWRWEIELDDDGNIADIYHTGEKLGDDEQLFNAIGPYVEAGSYIEMQGEDGAMWRWFFDGKQCLEQGGTVTYGD